MPRVKRGVAAHRRHVKVLNLTKGQRLTKHRLFRRANGMSYSRFINGLTNAQVAVNRKMLAEMAVNDPSSFAELVDVARGAVSA